jgi:hypothetical protein
MEKIKNFLFTTLGVIGYVIYYLVALAVSVFPLLMFNMPWWLYIILSLVAIYLVGNIPLAAEILWIIGLFGAISGKQDIFAIIYYVMFAIIVGGFIVNLIKVLLSKDK